jgi:uncharacterized membrane protein
MALHELPSPHRGWGRLAFFFSILAILSVEVFVVLLIMKLATNTPVAGWSYVYVAGVPLGASGGFFILYLITRYCSATDYEALVSMDFVRTFLLRLSVAHLDHYHFLLCATDLLLVLPLVFLTVFGALFYTYSPSCNCSADFGVFFLGLASVAGLRVLYMIAYHVYGYKRYRTIIRETRRFQELLDEHNYMRAVLPTLGAASFLLSSAFMPLLLTLSALIFLAMALVWRFSNSCTSSGNCDVVEVSSAFFLYGGFGVEVVNLISAVVLAYWKRVSGMTNVLRLAHRLQSQREDAESAAQDKDG